MKLVPVMVTLVPPVVGPDVGERPVTVGAGTKVKVPTELPVPPIVVTLTVTDPEPAGLTAVIWVAEFTTKLAAAVLPNITAVAPVKLVPVMVTLVPPVVGPRRRRQASNGRRGNEGEGADRGASAADRGDADRHAAGACGRDCGDLTSPS